MTTETAEINEFSVRISVCCGKVIDRSTVETCQRVVQRISVVKFMHGKSGVLNCTDPLRSTTVLGCAELLCNLRTELDCSVVRPTNGEMLLVFC